MCIKPMQQNVHSAFPFYIAMSTPCACNFFFLCILHVVVKLPWSQGKYSVFSQLVLYLNTLTAELVFSALCTHPASLHYVRPDCMNL